MAMTDPLADMLARIKNAGKQGYPEVAMPASKAKMAVLDVLKTEGYINGYNVQTTESGHRTLHVSLKYHQGQPVITRLTRVSKPGRRMYSQASEIPMVSNGLGVTIVSTSKGVMSDTQARAANVGGEIICQVF